jgi:hypothetical protein
LPETRPVAEIIKRPVTVNSPSNAPSTRAVSTVADPE